jgi:hypothetical protein
MAPLVQEFVYKAGEFLCQTRHKTTVNGAKGLWPRKKGGPIENVIVSGLWTNTTYILACTGYRVADKTNTNQHINVTDLQVVASETSLEYYKTRLPFYVTILGTTTTSTSTTSTTTTTTSTTTTVRCSCPNGVAKDGNCEATSPVHCTSCNDNYGLNGNVCVEFDAEVLDFDTTMTVPDVDAIISGPNKSVYQLAIKKGIANTLSVNHTILSGNITKKVGRRLSEFVEGTETLESRSRRLASGQIEAKFTANLSGVSNAQAISSNAKKNGREYD